MKSNLLNIAEQLTLRLQEPLPGRDAQLALMSERRLKEFESKLDTSGARESSVLILLYEIDGEIFFPLIKRPEYDGVHSGQIALPGGKKEPSDIDLIQTAFREANEEIGVNVEEVNFLGKLSPIYIPPSHFMVHVVLAYTESVPDFSIDTYEVDKLIHFPLYHLFKDDVIENRDVLPTKGLSMKAPGFVFDDYFIWGATAMILSELKSIINHKKKDEI